MSDCGIIFNRHSCRISFPILVVDNDGYILGDYLTNAHYDIQDMPACDIFDGREEEQLPTTDAGMLRYLWYLV